MFNKLKENLRHKLRLYLGVSDLEETFDKYKNKNDKNIFNHERNLEWCSEQFNNHRKQISQFDDKVEAIHNTLENVVHIGTDVRPYSNNREHSWAIICIEGKPNIVKFVDLDRKDAREIMDFLKHFESGRHCVDTPNREMFLDNLWQF